MPRLVSTAEGYQYWIPDEAEAEGNPLYQPQPQYNEDSKSFSLPVDPNDITGLPTFPVQHNLKPVGDRRGKEEKLAEMFGVVPGPEGPLDIVKSFVSGLTAPGEVAKGEVEQQDLLSRAIDTAGLGITGGFAKPPTMKQMVMKSDTSDVGKALSIAQQAKPFFTNVENSLAKIPMKSGTAEQWMNAFKRYGAGKEELEWTVGELPKGQITRQQIEQHLKDNAIQLQEHWKGELKFNKDSKYALPQVVKAAKQAGDTPGDLELVLANDGDAYRALTKRFPELAENENWAEIVAKDVFGGDTMPKGTSKYSQYQMPGGSNYRELLLTLPHTPRDKVRPSDAIFEAKYKKQWDENVAEVKKLEQELAETPRGDKPYWRQATKARINQLHNERDVLHNQMVDDTIAASRGRLGGQAYTNSHWDEPNVIAHVRMNDRVIDGKKSLHLEEIQSDWHQTGRKSGYAQQADKIKFDETNAALDVANKNLANVMYKIRQEHGLNSARDSIAQVNDINLRARMREERTKVYEASSEYKAAEAEVKRLEDEVSKYNYVNKVPNAPFKSNWDELALKKAIRHAVENGYDAISWTPGKHQSTNPSKQIKNVYLNNPVWHGENDIRGNLVATGLDGNDIITKKVSSRKEIEELIGKKGADELIDKPTSMQGRDHVLKGEGLDTGGTKEFYDKILVDKANKLVKQFGGKVEEKRIRNPKEADAYEELNRNQKTPVGDYDKAFPKVWTIKLTPELKKHALEKGFSLFSTTPVLIPIDHDPFKRQDVKLVPVVGNPFGEK